MDNYISKIEKLVSDRMKDHSKPTKGLLTPKNKKEESVTNEDMIQNIANYVHDIRMMRMQIKAKGIKDGR